MGAVAPLVHAHTQLCYRRLSPGMVKRTMAVGPLIGYWICCPACRLTGVYHAPALVESTEWTRTRGMWPIGPHDVDDEPTLVERDVPHPVDVAGQVTCQRCGATMVLGGGQIRGDILASQ